jgi:hypothetical protein
MSHTKTLNSKRILNKTENIYHKKYRCFPIFCPLFLSSASCCFKKLRWVLENWINIHIVHCFNLSYHIIIYLTFSLYSFVATLARFFPFNLFSYLSSMFIYLLVFSFITIFFLLRFYPYFFFVLLVPIFLCFVTGFLHLLQTLTVYAFVLETIVGVYILDIFALRRLIFVCVYFIYDIFKDSHESRIFNAE